MCVSERERQKAWEQIVAPFLCKWYQSPANSILDTNEKSSPSRKWRRWNANEQPKDVYVGRQWRRRRRRSRETKKFFLLRFSSISFQHYQLSRISSTQVVMADDGSRYCSIVWIDESATNSDSTTILIKYALAVAAIFSLPRSFALPYTLLLWYFLYFLAVSHALSLYQTFCYVFISMLANFASLYIFAFHFANNYETLFAIFSHIFSSSPISIYSVIGSHYKSRCVSIWPLSLGETEVGAKKREEKSF